jgi:antitoxin component of RelBE/YafQ-DinJ toxin-antitoxin module
MMTKKTYQVTLDKEAVEEALEIASNYGGKLSPILNNLLSEWIEQEKIKFKTLKKKEEDNKS